MDIIVDIDGTLADCTHRLHHIKSNPKNWKAFFDGMVDDKPIASTVEVVQILYGDYNNVIFCTGRPRSHEQITRDWLKNNLGNWTGNCMLMMRADKDFRPDYVVKEEMLSALKEWKVDPKVAFEDRDQVVDMWRKNGLTCYQVAKGEY